MFILNVYWTVSTLGFKFHIKLKFEFCFKLYKITLNENLKRWSWDPEVKNGKMFELRNQIIIIFIHRFLLKS